jgi:hypothetical protein
VEPAPKRFRPIPAKGPVRALHDPAPADHRDLRVAQRQRSAGRGRLPVRPGLLPGGNSHYDFTDPAKPIELGYADLEDGLGSADSWSTYFYNGTVFVNGGLNRRGATGNRGFEAYRVDGIGETPKWKWSNPQTQEAWQAP